MASSEPRHEPSDWHSGWAQQPGHTQPRQPVRGRAGTAPQRQREENRPWIWGSPPGEAIQTPGEPVFTSHAPRPDTSPRLDVALDLVKDTPEGRALAEKLDAFDQVDEKAKDKAAAAIRKDIADIVARAITEQHQRRELLDALSNVRNNQAVPEASKRREHHPAVAQVVNVAEEVLAKLGREMLIEALLPGAHVLLPPTDFIDSVLTAVTLIEIADHPAEIEDHPAKLEHDPTQIADHPAQIADHPAEIDDRPAILEDDPAQIEDHRTWRL